MSDDENLPAKDMWATCSTLDCESYARPVQISMPDEATVVCGACSQPITDITDQVEEGVSIPNWLKTMTSGT